MSLDLNPGLSDVLMPLSQDSRPPQAPQVEAEGADLACEVRDGFSDGGMAMPALRMRTSE